MKKFVLILIMLVMSFSQALAQDTLLEGSVLYNVESARKLAFEGLDLKLDKKLLKDYLYDENNKENRAALKKNIQPNERTLMSFSLLKGSVNGYVVVYDDKPQYAYYYSTSGYLVGVDYDNRQDDTVFPYKVGKYNPITGNLISIGLYISEDEQYAYSKDGKLKAHWVGNTGYNAKGKPIATRSVVSEIPNN